MASSSAATTYAVWREALTTSVICEVVVNYTPDSIQSDDLALFLSEPAITLRSAELAAAD